MYARVFIVLCALLLPAVCASARLLNRADSIMQKVFENREFFKYNIDEYFAKVYIKGGNRVVKKNFLYRFAPDFLYMENDAFIESSAELHYKAPNFYSQRIEAVNNPKAATGDIEERLMQFLHVNIYNPSLINNEIRLPGAKGSERYYRFEYAATLDTLGYTLHVVRVKPKIRSQELVSGYYYIVDGTSMIIKIDLEGKREFARFRIICDYNAPDMDFLLPSKTEVFFTTRLLNNQTENHYTAFFDYISVKRRKPDWQRKNSYNLSEYFIETRKLSVNTDETFWTAIRAEPLTDAEDSLVYRHALGDGLKNRSGWLNRLAKGVFTPRRFHYKNAQMRYSGLLNPLKISYSKLDGWLYWQQLDYSKTFANGHELQFTPRMGFLLQKNKIYFRTPVRWVFKPRRMGEFYFNFENRSQSSLSKEVVEELQKTSPDLANTLFNHYKTSLEAKCEIANGLILRGGLNGDRYIPVEKAGSQHLTGLPDNLKNLVTSEYRIFSPLIGLQWTPSMYYRIDGKRKIYVESAFPTFSAEYVRGARLWNSDSDYSKIEFDIQHRISTGLMSSFQYYLGTGKFFNVGSMYFTNFNCFQRRHFPSAWGDPIGGVFHLLDSYWYDASREYVQAHLMYEFPYTLFRPFRGITKDILKERIYVSQLYTSIRSNYTELGYGVGNYIGNAAIFVSFNEFRYESVGVKFAFDLF